jgi:hypothetical protein
MYPLALDDLRDPADPRGQHERISAKDDWLDIEQGPQGPANCRFLNCWHLRLKLVTAHTIERGYGFQACASAPPQAHGTSVNMDAQADGGRGVFKSVDERFAAIDAWLAERNIKPKPIRDH